MINQDLAEALKAYVKTRAKARAEARAEAEAIEAKLAEQPAPVQQEPAYTYTSTQATRCARCGEHKHTPLRIDNMGGYVCLTCIDKQLCTPPAQRKPLTPTVEADTGYSRAQRAAFKEGWEEAEAAHGIKENT